MSNKLKLLLVDVKSNYPVTDIKVVEIEDELKNYYKLLQCSCVCMPIRWLGDRYFNIYCDDNGLLKENPIIAAFSADNEEYLVGNLIFAHTDREGYTTSLSDDDISYIKRFIRPVKLYENGEVRIRALIGPYDYCSPERRKENE